MEKKSVFEVLNAIDCSTHIEKKNELSYLSWAWAWAMLKKAYPTATFKIYEDTNGMFYHTDGKTCWVKTGVTVEGIEMVEYLPVMDFRNHSIPLDKVTSTDVNKSIQRSLTKAAARHGLGLYVYAGEDLPEEVSENKQQVDKRDAHTIACDRLMNAGKGDDIVATLESLKNTEHYDVYIKIAVGRLTAIINNSIKECQSLDMLEKIKKNAFTYEILKEKTSENGEIFQKIQNKALELSK